MAVVTNYGSNSISLFPIRNGKLGKRVDVPVSAGPTQVVIGDLNGDGINEIAVACLPANKVDLLTKVNGSREDDLSSYAVTSSLVLPEGSAPADLKAVDLNGDGKTDLVIADFSKNTVSIYYQQKDGSLFAQPTLSTSGSHPNGLTVADLNGDGKKEIIVANRDSDSLDIFSPNNAGQYQLTQTLKVAQDTDPTFGPVEVAALDASGHGKLDLVASHMRTNSIRVLPQEGLALPTSAPVSGPGGAVPSSPAFSEQTTYCYPNPARYGKINLCFSLSAPAEVVIRIFDITGKLVWTQTFPDSQTQTGANSIHWAGVNQLGRNLASGLYLYSITVGGQTVTKKIAIIH
jgi:hypothetical protein